MPYGRRMLDHTIDGNTLDLNLFAPEWLIEHFFTLVDALGNAYSSCLDRASLHVEFFCYHGHDHNLVRRLFILLFLYLGSIQQEIVVTVSLWDERCQRYAHFLAIIQPYKNLSLTTALKL
jgi:hypothetical protein